MNNVIDIEEAKPYITVNGLTQVHVVPLSLIEAMSTGEIKLSDVDGANDFIPTLLIEWLKR